ncbi:hypothetical protein ScalyP_jg1251 [Parmales sp. scaly parma]|nr:hypothetical protein ScalyP_jg1251 [Parmales sp. scaly parma]
MEFQNINNPVQKGQAGGAAKRGTRIQEAGAHFNKDAAIFVLEQKDTQTGETTTVSFFATCVVITTSLSICCSLPSVVTTTIPKFRIKDVNIHEKPLCCGNIGYDACLTRFCCATFCKCGMVAKPQKTVEFILRAESGASSWAPTPTVEVKVMTDLPEELILHYVYGPLLNSGDQTHALSHMIENKLAAPAHISLDMDRL